MTSPIDQISFYQNRRDEVPNQELAHRLASDGDREGIAEIAANLWNANPAVRSDCLKVLYEIGYLRPELIAPYTGEFLKLLKSRDNRLVWGAMIALATLAPLAADAVDAGRSEIVQAVQTGSVITRDAGVQNSGAPGRLPARPPPRDLPNAARPPPHLPSQRRPPARREDCRGGG